MCGQLERGQPGRGRCRGHGSRGTSRALGTPGRHSVVMGTCGVLAVTRPAGTALSETCSLAKLAQTLRGIVESPSIIKIAQPFATVSNLSFKASSNLGF